VTIFPWLRPFLLKPGGREEKSEIRLKGRRRRLEETNSLKKPFQFCQEFTLNLSSMTHYDRAVVAEWLRRLTRNQIPYGSAGSNPADCGYILFKSVEP
jgi:hypothetical protein